MNAFRLSNVCFSTARLLAVIVALGIATTAQAQRIEAARTAPMNSIIAIHPYKYHGMWVFDDVEVGLRKEPFVSGADDIIEHMVRDIPSAERGFTLLFSSEPFPGYQVKFEWLRAEMSGSWYRSSALGMEGWLCPALLKYLDSPPPRIYAQFRAKAR
jgi:hypothetical protein